MQQEEVQALYDLLCLHLEGGEEKLLSEVYKGLSTKQQEEALTYIAEMWDIPYKGVDR